MNTTNFGVPKANAGDQVFIATPYPSPTIKSNGNTTGFVLNNKIILGLGICTLVFGFITMLCGICSTALFGPIDYNVASGGIWGGVLIIVSGIIAVISSCRPRNPALNGVNLGLHCFVLCICISVLALAGLSLDYYDTCFRWYWYRNNWCPNEDGPLTTYSIIVICACAQLGISTTMIVFCSRAFQCCGKSCSKDQTDYRSVTHPQTFQTGSAVISANVQPIPSGQILYMMQPVAVTTQHPPAPGNPIPQATLVMNPYL